MGIIICVNGFYISSTPLLTNLCGESDFGLLYVSVYPVMHPPFVERIEYMPGRFCGEDSEVG